MKKFIATFLLFCVPVFVVLIAYAAFDPFKVVWSYDTFFNAQATGQVGLDKDYVSTATFERQHPAARYNSFIFGNSRSMFYETADWKKHLGADSRCFHFDANLESLYALHKKILFLDGKNVEIKNALLVLDHSILEQDKPQTGHLCALSPHLVENENLFSFHAAFLKAFLSPRFLVAFLDFKISNRIKPYMTRNFLLVNTPIAYDAPTNEMRFDHFEKLIRDGRYYTDTRTAVFYKRDSTQHESPPAVGESQKEMLEDIAAVFAKHNTNCKIVISPLYDQVKFNAADLKYLDRLFGSENVFDFSGVNRITNDYRNYYEASHYRPHVAREIMDTAYANRGSR